MGLNKPTRTPLPTGMSCVDHHTVFCRNCSLPFYTMTNLELIRGQGITCQASASALTENETKLSEVRV